MHTMRNVVSLSPSTNTASDSVEDKESEWLFNNIKNCRLITGYWDESNISFLRAIQYNRR